MTESSRLLAVQAILRGGSVSIILLGVLGMVLVAPDFVDHLVAAQQPQAAFQLAITASLALVACCLLWAVGIMALGGVIET